MKNKNDQLPYKLAIALEYEPRRSEAPTVAAKGAGLSAEQVVRIARRFSVPVVERGEVARALNTLEIDQHIPEELYEAVAVILNELDRR